MTLEPSKHVTSLTGGEIVEESDGARMTVMDPAGTLDTWYLKEGDVYFIPRAYPHHIEVIDDLPTLPFTKVDPLIVTRNNPVDPR